MAGSSLVLFYSWSGNTRQVARIIAQKTGADLQEIQPSVPYPKDYEAVVAQAQREIREKVRPELEPLRLEWDRYETIYLGTPNWHGTMAPPMASFLYQTMPTEKNILPFCTHGGGGSGRIPQDMAFYCMGCDMLPTLSLQDNGTFEWDTQITAWLQRTAKILTMLNEEGLR